MYTNRTTKSEVQPCLHSPRLEHQQAESKIGFTVLNRTNRMGARLCSKIAFFYRALWKVKVPLCPWSLLIPIELD